MKDLSGKRVAIVATDGFEQSELFEPKKALEAAGATTDVVSLKPGRIRGWAMKDWGDDIAVDRVIDGASADDYDALMLPGGVINPDKLRTQPAVLAFVRAFFEQGKPVGAICHGPWTLINAGVVKGRHVTSWPSLQVDLQNAGADLDRRGSRVAERARHLAQARRPAGVQPQADRGDRRRRPRGPQRRDEGGRSRQGRVPGTDAVALREYVPSKAVVQRATGVLRRFPQLPHATVGQRLPADPLQRRAPRRPPARRAPPSPSGRPASHRRAAAARRCCPPRSGATGRSPDRKR